MPSAVFDYEEIRKRVRADYLFGREAMPVTSAPAQDTPSTVGTSAVIACDWCGKIGTDAASCPHNRNTGIEINAVTRRRRGDLRTLVKAGRLERRRYVERPPRDECV